MNRKAIITLAVLLGIAGAISYAIIWFRNRKASPSPSVGGEPATNNDTTKPVGTGYALPKVQSYAWWTNKLGHAKFPLGLGSKGVEVLKVQEVLNTKKLPAGGGKIAEDGAWGAKTEARFKQWYPQYSAVTQFQFITDFDPNREIL